MAIMTGNFPKALKAGPTAKTKKPKLPKVKGAKVKMPKMPGMKMGKGMKCGK